MLIDWVTATFHHVTVDEVKLLLNLEEQLWEEGGRFRQHGYLTSESIGGITLSSGSDHEGMKHTVNVVVSGNGCRFLEEHIKSWPELFQSFYLSCEEHSRKLNFTRIDLAIDDRREADELTMAIDWLHDKIVSGECKTRIKNVAFKNGRKIRQPGEEEEKNEELLTLGSRSSETYIRIYNKRLEQLSKLRQAPKDKQEEMRRLIPDRWDRLEIEIKGDKANQVGRMVADDLDMSHLALGILNNNLELVDRTYLKNGALKKKRSWVTNPKWKAFIGEVEKIKLVTEPKNLNLEQKILYIEKAHGKTLAMIDRAEKGLTVLKKDDSNQLIGMSRPKILDTIIRESKDKLDTKDYHLVAEYVAHHQKVE